MRIIHLTLWIFLAVSIISCGEKPVFSEKIAIDGSWSYDDKLSFPINVERIDLDYDLLLTLSYATDFGYQNIYVKIITQYPNSRQIEDVLSLNLTNGSGLFLGDCNSSKCEITILLQEQFKFKEKGKHIITIIQNSREENLDGIFSAELKLFETKK